MSIRSHRRLLSFVLACLFVLPSIGFAAPIESTRTQPENGSVTDKPIRSLRIWFDTAPVVDESEVSISGPVEATKAVGTHTMGENDLMVRISGPMPDGEYTVRWKAAGEDGESNEGSFTFTVKRAE